MHPASEPTDSMNFKNISSTSFDVLKVACSRKHRTQKSEKVSSHIPALQAARLRAVFFLVIFKEQSDFQVLFPILNLDF